MAPSLKQELTHAWEAATPQDKFLAYFRQAFSFTYAGVDLSIQVYHEALHLGPASRCCKAAVIPSKYGLRGELSVACSQCYRYDIHSSPCSGRELTKAEDFHYLVLDLERYLHTIPALQLAQEIGNFLLSTRAFWEDLLPLDLSLSPDSLTRYATPSATLVNCLRGWETSLPFHPKAKLTLAARAERYEKKPRERAHLLDCIFPDSSKLWMARELGIPVAQGIEPYYAMPLIFQGVYLHMRLAARAVSVLPWRDRATHLWLLKHWDTIQL